MNHTPGPWFSPDGKTIKQDYRPALSDAAGCMIGAVMGGSASGPAFIEVDEEVAANTKLICAAPDLLDALEALADYVDEMHRIGHIQRPVQSSEARAAIAKARGNNQ